MRDIHKGAGDGSCPGCSAFSGAVGGLYNPDITLVKAVAFSMGGDRDYGSGVYIMTESILPALVVTVHY